MDPFNLQITYNDGTSKNVEAKAVDLVAFEDYFDISITALSKSPRIKYLFFLAWNVEKRTNATELSFDDWLPTIEMVSEAQLKK
jgi:hypothetical protein